MKRNPLLKWSKRLLITITSLYLLLCIGMYFFQNNLIFHPEKTPSAEKYTFDFPFEERFFSMEDGTKLHGLFFPADSSNGLVFYLHGNSGNVKGYGGIAPKYTQLGYDVLFVDYRGFGKSEGDIENQEELYQDLQTVYDAMKKKYSETEITLLGFSIGTGPSAYLASVNHPKRLILEAPYFSLKDMMTKRYPFVPTFLLKYPLTTNEYLANVPCPVTIIHGKDDETIPFSSSLRLKSIPKKGVQFFPLENQGHNGISDHASYDSIIREILN